MLLSIPSPIPQAVRSSERRGNAAGKRRKKKISSSSLPPWRLEVSKRLSKLFFGEPSSLPTTTTSILFLVWKTADVFELLTINNNKAPTVQRRVGLGASCWHLVTLLLTKKSTDLCNACTHHSAVHTKYYTVTTYALLYWTTICLWRICWWSIALPLRMHWAPPGYKGFPKVSAAKQQFLPSTAAGATTK